MERKIVTTATLFGAIAIVFGAFGAHALKKILPLDALNTFETGVKYQMYHALFLLFVAMTPLVTIKVKKSIFYLVTSGVVLFSGSIYLLATNSLTVFDFKTIGFLTPIGGLLLISAWGILFLNVLKKKQ